MTGIWGEPGGKRLRKRIQRRREERAWKKEEK